MVMFQIGVDRNAQNTNKKVFSVYSKAIGLLFFRRDKNRKTIKNNNLFSNSLN